MISPNEDICALWPDCQALTDEGYLLCPRHQAVLERPLPDRLEKHADWEARVAIDALAAVGLLDRAGVLRAS